MTLCPALSSRTPDFDVITERNKFEPITDTFDRTPGTVVNLRCFSNYTLAGPSTLTCGSGGSWGVDTIPKCNPPKVVPGTIYDNTDSSITDDQKVIIAVVCAVAGLILLVLLIMCCVVYCWKRKLDNSRSRDGLTRQEIAMYAKQQSVYNRSHRGDLDRSSRDFDRSSRVSRDFPRDDDRSSHLSYGMYLPRDGEERRPYGPYDQRAPSVHSGHYSHGMWRNSTSHI